MNKKEHHTYRKNTMCSSTKSLWSTLKHAVENLAESTRHQSVPYKQGRAL